MKVNAYRNLIKKNTSGYVFGDWREVSVSALLIFLKKLGTPGGNPKKEKNKSTLPSKAQLLYSQNTVCQRKLEPKLASIFFLILPLSSLRFSVLQQTKRWLYLFLKKTIFICVPDSLSFSQVPSLITTFALLSQILLFHKSSYIYLCHKSPLQ